MSDHRINKDFPRLTEDHDRIYRIATYDTLIEKFNMKIYREDILTLQPEGLLNDNIINFYMKLLMKRGERFPYLKVYAFDTRFVEKLYGGYKNVQRWTKNVDIFDYDIIAIPVHIPSIQHWCMAICNMMFKTINYYNSMGQPNDRLLDRLIYYLHKEHFDKKKIELDMTQWTCNNVADHPQQVNGYDCGVFSCMTAEFICRNRQIIFTQSDMEYFRKKMTMEICYGKMLN